MLRNNAKLSNVTYPFVLKSCSTLSSMLEEMCCKCFCLDSSQNLWVDMEVRDEDCNDKCVWERKGFYGDVEFVFRMLVLADEVQLNAVTTVCLLFACSNLWNYGVGRFLFVFIDVNKIPLNSILVTALIDMYYKCGDVEKAWRIFDGVSYKKLPPWNAIITGYVQHETF
ncbi:Pentatricopeptide repeat-containing protein ELI1, chloroplastic [Vitis vinifera]|uniref:Pentatricopeptide repeat-containing protein ELI1, chloroplastic n=1 Tax=Vitis vinifera TaxID=29760 RepID=A0A438FUC8_VITVI|nr:Pentatricopeptide repeat-containing protein ELI1, chloroplastic [Vitis vinifera]